MRREPYWAVIGVGLIGNDDSTPGSQMGFFLLLTAFYCFLLFSSFMTLNETHQKKKHKT